MAKTTTPGDETAGPATEAAPSSPDAVDDPLAAAEADNYRRAQADHTPIREGE